MVLIDRAASEHKRRRKKGTRLSRSRKPVTTLRGITWETSDTARVSTTGEKQKTDRMIVVPSGAHLGVFSVLQRLRSVILTSLPLSAVSPLCRGRNGRLSSRGRCQSPMQRAKRHRSTMYILLVLRERASSVRFLCFCFSIEFILRLSFSLFVCHRCHIAFLGRDVISLFPLGAVCFVSLSPLPFRSVQRANVYPLGVLVFLGGLASISYCVSRV